MCNFLPLPPSWLRPLIAYSVTRYIFLSCFRYTLINVLIGKHNPYFFQITFDCVHSPITNLTRYDKQSSTLWESKVWRWRRRRRRQRRAACVIIIASPAATTVAARHHPCIMFVTMTHCVFEHRQQVLQGNTDIGHNLKKWPATTMAASASALKIILLSPYLRHR